MQYRCVATSPEALVQQVAVCYLRHGYWWYVTGRIPDGKDPKNVDVKLIAIGNGTASRETDRFVGDLLREHPEAVLFEIGPGATLASLARQQESWGAGHLGVPVLRKGFSQAQFVAFIQQAIQR